MIKSLTVLLALLLPSLGSAGVITTNTTNGVEHIRFTGTIVEGDDVRLEKFLEDNPDIEWVSFDSPGGDSNMGHQISILLGEYLMGSVVFSGDSCMSACAMAFIGGERLSIDGEIGFHSWYYDEFQGDGRIRLDKADIRSDIYDAQWSTTLDTYNIMSNGFSWDLHFDYVILKGEFLMMYDNSDLEAYYIGGMHISNNYSDGYTKEFVSFGKTKVDTSFIDLEPSCLHSNTKHTGEIKFKRKGIHTFWVGQLLEGEETHVFVDDHNTWKAGESKKGYTHIFAGSHNYATSGWVSTSAIEKICK